jgi:hypothetical protein
MERNMYTDANPANDPALLPRRRASAARTCKGGRLPVSGTDELAWLAELL